MADSLRPGMPLDAAWLLRKKKSLRQDLLNQAGLLEKRIAVLAGSTSAEVVDQLELALLLRGIRPVFFRGEYGQYYQEALAPSPALRDFRPDLVYLHTSAVNIQRYPQLTDSPDQIDSLLQQQVAHFQQVWEALAQQHRCTIIQNNMELPWYRPLGNLDGSEPRGRTRFVMRLNEALLQATSQRNDMVLHDIHYLSARIGIDRWFNPRLWYWAKYAMDMEVIPLLAQQLAALMASVWGKSAKALVLDLDNTLWGGVVGDDGLQGIALGADSAAGEAHQDFQRYLASLRERGLLLAVASKNEEAIAREAFSHPDSVLQLKDFAAFQAHWNPKPGSVQAIAAELNIGVDSLVFVDDNPAERDLMRQQLPQVTVPELGEEVTDFIRILDQAALFETLALSTEDLQRNEQYRANLQREAQLQTALDYPSFLRSLQMQAEIAPFSTLYLDRITQLVHKTNQFNLTTRLCQSAEIAQMIQGPDWITLYGRLQDRFGDNGLVSVVAGEIQQDQLQLQLHLRLWLMSCRVLKRGMEQAMFHQLCERARARGITVIVGYYLPTAKNAMVANMYQELGFSLQKNTAAQNTVQQSIWHYDLKNHFPPAVDSIEVIREQE